ncbi:MAG: cupin domain-containing protein [Prevotellaceae bacterium]|nr:cupin domain-containing protein [Prevotellaceae bacterium]
MKLLLIDTRKTIIACFAVMNIANGLAQQKDTPAVKADKLLETTTSWNGAKLPQYPEGEPQINIIRYTIKPHTKMKTHRHAIINGGIMLKGELTIVSETGEEKTFKAGDALVETTGTWHYGENKGDEPVEVVMFYAGAKGKALSEAK